MQSSLKKSSVFWVITQCMVVWNRRFGTTYRFGSIFKSHCPRSLTLEDVKGNPETSVSNQHTPRNNPEYGRINFNHGGSLKANSHVPCRVPAVLRLCRFSTSRGHGRGTALYVCELTSAVFRRPVGDLARFGFFRIPRGVSRLAVRCFPVTRGLSRRTRHCRRKAGAQHSMCVRNLCRYSE